ncbi:MAG TPA: hypothetical protein PLJ35_05550 [Anaerolineae bacterium]|nr:hypothetical protein [Anaerolineae bacterium]HOQ98267.1 hypothetical protein [Anaerolineae bacterium]HPL28969.1 hypothetical protein [Anaerolineae bacterium]
MAKKSAKRRSQVKSAVRQAERNVVSAAGTTTIRPSAAAEQPAPAHTTADLAGEYRYVLGDLRRIGILAASMFALLVAIALVAQFVIK